MGLSILTNWKDKSYDSILVIVDQLIKLIYYKLIKIRINELGLTKVIIDIIIRHYSLFNVIIIN